MRCLMCGKKIEEQGFSGLFYQEDLLCGECRGEWQKDGTYHSFGDFRVYTSYIYNDAFSSCLLQFKECGDEALMDVFLYKIKNELRKKYHGYTWLLMPSTAENEERRGFHHLKEMFGSLHMPVMEPFEKDSDEIQKKLSYEERQKMSSRIRLKKNIRIPPKVVLADDIVTTGATMRGARNALAGRKIKIAYYAVAYVEKKQAFLNRGD
ncbi:MAG: ComF family protein [Solobacterium sp.]|nr:ComF family protein [Solobacterium sp.]